MNTSGAVQVEEEARHDGAPEILEREAISGGSFVNDWLFNHANALAFAVVAAGFGLRIFAAARSYLNPDEALHYQLLNQPSAFLTYKASLTNAHPPLTYLVLHFWHFLGQSELMLRLPSVIAGTAFCWIFYKWMGLVLGREASWMGLILMTFSPAMVALSAQVREYAPLLLCMGSALYFLERAFEDKRVRKMWCFSVFLYLAILFNYSAVFFAVATGAYTLARIADSQLSRKVVVAWAYGQAGAVAICGFLYVTHVTKLKNGEMAILASPFKSAFYHVGDGSLFTFTRVQTSDIFLFLFENEYVSQAMLLIFVAGVAVLLIRDLVSHRDGRRSWHLGILLLLPFIAVWGAAIVGIYPYIGGRHTVFLAPSMIAGVSYLIAIAFGRKFWAVILFAGLIVGASYTSGKTYEPYIKPENQSRALMNDAMNHLRQSVPRGDHILVDYQSSLSLAYYLCGPNVIMPIETLSGGDFEFTCDGYSIVSLRIWKLVYQDFPSEFEKMASTRGLKSGDRVWVFQSGWGANLDTELPWFNLKFRCLAPASFGENITVIPFVVGADMFPALPPGSPHLTRLMRCSN
jgi:dolichyl-phosphate-mannose-protein mannosyltransferase